MNKPQESRQRLAERGKNDVNYDSSINSMNIIFQFELRFKRTKVAPMQRLPYFSYDTTHNKWIKNNWFAYGQVSHEQSVTSPLPSALSILTFNVLFDIYKFQRIATKSTIRYQYQLEKLREMNIDLICLQEVTGTFLKMMEGDPWIQQNYYVSHCISDRSCASQLGAYGNVILSKYPFAELHEFRYPCMRDKCCIIASFVSSENSSNPECQRYLSVVSCHLKANDNVFDWTQIRRKQLNNLFTQIEITPLFTSEYNDTIVCGDLNFFSLEDEKSIPCKYVDMWTLVNRSEDGHTFDCKSNTMISKLFPKYSPISLRLDRGLLLSVSQRWKVVSATLEMKEPICQDIFASDHFAVKFHLIQQQS